MDNYKPQAEAYIQGLKLKFIPHGDVVEWVDSIISHLGDPPVWTLDITTFEGSDEELIWLLEKVPGESDVIEVWRRIKQLVKKELTKNNISLVNGIAYMNCFRDSDMISEAESDKILYFVANWDSIQDGFGNINDFHNEFLVFLAQ